MDTGPDLAVLKTVVTRERSDQLEVPGGCLDLCRRWNETARIAVPCINGSFSTHGLGHGTSLAKRNPSKNGNSWQDVAHAIGQKTKMSNRGERGIQGVGVTRLWLGMTLSALTD